MATFSKLSSTEQLNGGYTHRCVITHADLTDTDTAQAITLATLTEGQFVTRAAYALTTDFASANGTGLTMSVGNASSATGYTAAKELQGTEIDYWAASIVSPPTGAPDQAGETEAVIATFTTSGGSSPLLSEYTAGQLTILLRVEDIKALA